MPGVLIIEALAQAAALFSFEDDSGVNPADKKIAYYLVGVDGARFRRPVVPGDQLRLEVTADRISRSICKYTAKASVDGQVARSEEHTSELQSLMRISYAVFCLKQKKTV